MGHQQHNQASAAAREQSVLAMLRALVPNRPLTPSETLRIAELQANHLLRHFQIETAAVPEEIVSELPRIRVVREAAARLGRRSLERPLLGDHPQRRRELAPPAVQPDARVQARPRPHDPAHSVPRHLLPERS